MKINFQDIIETRNILDERGYKRPTPKTVSKKRRKLRADIEETFGETWGVIERRLSDRVKKVMAKRHFLIRSSPQFIAVIEMILAGEKATKVMSFLRQNDSERFSAKLISDNALMQQIIRFQEELTSILSENSQEFCTVLDLYARLSGKHYDPMAMMKKLILVQESRVSDALEKEAEAHKALLQLPVDKRTKKLTAIFRMTSREIDRLQRYAMGYLLYEMMNKPCSYEQKEFVHCVLRAYRHYLPRYTNKGIQNH